MGTNENNVKKGEEKYTSLKRAWQVLNKFLGNNLVALVLGAIIIPRGLDFLDDFNVLKEQVTRLETTVEVIGGNYEATNSRVWELTAQVYSAKKDTENNDITEAKAVNLMPNENLIQCASSAFSSDKKVFEDENREVWDSKEVIIGTAMVNMSEGEALEPQNLTVKDLEDQFVTFAYKEDGEDVFFYGKFSNENKWDGNCIINRYKDGKLKFIMDAEYNNGNLNSYKQVFVGENGEGKIVWYVSERKVEGNSNSGETRRYFKFGDYEQNIDSNSITRNDILNVDDFCATIPSPQEAYYNGYTSDGVFNDDTGNAYLAKYNESGRLIYLYKGRMEGGWPADNSGNAWSLIWVEKDKGYYYYKGRFSNGKRSTTPKNWKPSTQDEIKSIVKPSDFNCSLQGLFDDPI